MVTGVRQVYHPPSRGTCYQYAIVTEKAKNVKICGLDRRELNVYTSRQNRVEIRFITRKNVESDKDYHFLLQFEGELMLYVVCAA